LSAGSLLWGFVGGALLLALPWPIAPRMLAVQGVIVCGFAVCAVLCVPAANSRAWCRHALCVLLGLGCGLVWSGAAHERALALRVPPDVSKHASTLVIRVASDPAPIAGAEGTERAVRFLADVVGAVGSHERANAHAGRRLRLAWYEAPAVLRGETWRVAAVVRSPWGYANPAGFDQERWMLGQHIHGTGTIRRGALLAAADPGAIAVTRSRLVAFVTAQELQFGPVLSALLVGSAVDIPEPQWDTFRVTGTIHLMVVSGLHIAMAAALGLAMGQWLVRSFPLLLLRLDARKAGALSGAACGIVYLALAGGGVPALRACVMAVPVFLLLACGWRWHAAHTALVGLAVILLVEPLAVHQQGFWLSFAAVLVLLGSFSGCYGRIGALANVVHLQWRLTVCMAPLLVMLTGAIPLVGMIANLVAVPLVSAVVMPLVLGAGLLCGAWPAVAATALRIADWLFALVYMTLEACRHVPQAHAQPPDVLTAVALLASVVWLVGVPRGQGVLLATCIAALVLPRAANVAPGEFRVLGLDVGQGDAIVVDTARHRLLFDTGPRFPGGFETGSAVVVPNLLATGPGALDALVLSHADADHVGGALAIVDTLPVVRAFASFPWRDARACAAETWDWDGVTFRFLEPERFGAERGSNDASCVLLIDNGRRRVLLAGDISERIEAPLLRLLPGPVELMFAPHHGSGSSSSRAFVRVARPREVFVSAGRDNRYGHPHSAALARYRGVGSAVHQTGRDGALEWQSDTPHRVGHQRASDFPYWRGTVKGGH
jgi:competence protein ComEC